MEPGENRSERESAMGKRKKAGGHPKTGNNRNVYPKRGNKFHIQDHVLMSCRSACGTVTVPEGIRTIGPYAFANCMDLEEVRLPDTLVRIGSYAFLGTGLKKLEIPESVRAIGDGAFAFCGLLSEVTMPIWGPDMEIGMNPFLNCEVERVTMTGTFRTPVSWENRSTRSGYWAGLRDLYSSARLFWAPQIPCRYLPPDENLKCAVLTAFAERELAGEPIPEEVRQDFIRRLLDRRRSIWVIPPVFQLFLDRRLFRLQDMDDCLAEAERRNDLIMKAALLDYQDREFTTKQREQLRAKQWDLSAEDPVSEYRKLRENWKIRNLTRGICSLTSWQGLETDITVPERIGTRQVTALGRSALSPRKSGLEERLISAREKIQRIDLPDGLLQIGDRAFLGCEGLEQIHLPDTLTELGQECFKECTKLQEISIPAGVKTVPQQAFQACKELRWVHFAEGLQTIEKEAFYYCLLLEEAVLPDTLEELGQECFASCRSLRTVRLPKGLKQIPRGAFAGCNALSDLILPDTLQNLGQQAFGGCAMSELRIPSGITEIPLLAFHGCRNLKQVLLPEGLKAIRSYAFEDCSALTEIWFPESLEVLNDQAFCGCISLRKIVLPAHAVRIGNYCFYHCDALQEVTLPGTGGEALLRMMVREHPGITLFVPRDSETAEYARSRSIPVILI